MFVIGSHLSISKGYLNMGKEATKKLGAIHSNILHGILVVVVCVPSM